MNKLYYGDCLAIMQDMRLGSVDLIYLDPPWNSNRAYNAIYRDSTGLELPDQVEAFCDIWELTPERESVIRNMPVLMAQAGLDSSVGKLWELWLRALRETQPRLLAYLLYMTERLIVMKGLLKPTGSIYLHCDSTASHYIKTLMDAIFGHRRFRNEIIWKRSNPKSLGSVNLPTCTDIILRYSKGDKVVFHQPYEAHDPDYVSKAYRHKDEKGIYRLLPLLNPNADRPNLTYEFLGVERVWRWTKERMQKAYEDGIVVQLKAGAVPQYKKYLEDSKGRTMTNCWTDIPQAAGKESLGYPTQKPLALLKRIIAMSSNEGQRVLDPFCGCATTICAAHELNRKWIGIDIAYHAIKRVAQVRLTDEYGLVEGEHYTVTGVPRTLEGAQNLWRQDKYHFQRWAVEQVNGFVTTKRTADGGIDGRLYFALPGNKQLQSMIIEVKGGRNVGINVMRELRGALERDEAAMAGLIVMEPLSNRKQQNFMREASSVGMLDVMGVEYPRMQILSVPDIVGGQSFLTPTVAGRGIGQESLPLRDIRSQPISP